ncbi:hypothetical protein [Paenibacillus lautus]|uniref:hypothetical protein n=1 Tax=Paenibacillus lautus TaxID=1401 RepID=UPI001FE3A4A4|nr:hypothetical protein [Paenibacillus lautus]
MYKEIDLEAIMNRLQSGEMVELPEVYLGLYKKFRTRLLICKLTEEQTQKRLLMRAKQEKKKNMTYKERTKRLSAINIYKTNAPDIYLKKSMFMTCIPYAGKSRFYLKRGNPSSISTGASRSKVNALNVMYTGS